jgi:Integrase core domain
MQVLRAQRGHDTVKNAVRPVRIEAAAASLTQRRFETELGQPPTESFFNSLKSGRVHDTRYRTHCAAVADLFEYIEVFYDRSRRHSLLGFMSPTQFMQDWLAAQQTKDTCLTRASGRRTTKGTSDICLSGTANAARFPSRAPKQVSAAGLNPFSRAIAE